MDLRKLPSGSGSNDQTTDAQGARSEAPEAPGPMPAPGSTPTLRDTVFPYVPTVPLSQAIAEVGLKGIVFLPKTPKPRSTLIPLADGNGSLLLLDTKPEDEPVEPQQEQRGLNFGRLFHALGGSASHGSINQGPPQPSSSVELAGESSRNSSDSELEKSVVAGGAGACATFPEDFEQKMEVGNGSPDVPEEEEDKPVPDTNMEVDQVLGM